MKGEYKQERDLCELLLMGYTPNPRHSGSDRCRSHAHTPPLRSHTGKKRRRKGQPLCPLNFCSQTLCCFVPLSTNCSKNLPPAASSESKILNKFPKVLTCHNYLASSSPSPSSSAKRACWGLVSWQSVQCLLFLKNTLLDKDFRMDLHLPIGNVLYISIKLDQLKTEHRQADNIICQDFKN